MPNESAAPTIFIQWPMFEEARTVELMQRGDAIRKRLFGGFPNLGFLWAAKDQVAWMDGNRALLSAAM